jgi:hypothetical protein
MTNPKSNEEIKPEVEELAQFIAMEMGEDGSSPLQIADLVIKLGYSRKPDLVPIRLQEDIRAFIYDVTLFLQKHHSVHSKKQMDDMFSRAYSLYSKYDVENSRKTDPVPS